MRLAIIVANLLLYRLIKIGGQNFERTKDQLFLAIQTFVHSNLYPDPSETLWTNFVGVDIDFNKQEVELLSSKTFVLFFKHLRANEITWLCDYKLKKSMQKPNVQVWSQCCTFTKQTYILTASATASATTQLKFLGLYYF